MSTIFQDYEARQQKLAESNRQEYFGHHKDIPDLEFNTPDCPICWLNTEYDDGWFTCYGCDVSWHQNGSGKDAMRADGSERPK